MNYQKSYFLLLFGVWGGVVIDFCGLFLVSKGIVIGNIIAVIGLIGI